MALHLGHGCLFEKRVLVYAVKSTVYRAADDRQHIALRHRVLERRSELPACDFHRADDLSGVVLEVAVVGERLLHLPLAPHPFRGRAVLLAALERGVVGLAGHLLHDNEVARRVRTRVLREESVGQTHRPDDLTAVLREELAQYRAGLVERAGRCQERHHASRTQFRKRLGEEVVVDLEHPGRERTVADRNVRIRHVVDREVEEPVWELRFLEPADGHALVREERLEDFARHRVLLHEMPVDGLLVLPRRAREVARAGGRPEEAPALDADPAQRVVQHPHKVYRRVECRRCGRLCGFVLVVVQDLPQLLVELVGALADALTFEISFEVASSRALHVVGAFKFPTEHVLAQTAPAHELGKRRLLVRRRHIVARLEVAYELDCVEVVADALCGFLFEDRILNRFRHYEIAAGWVYLCLVGGFLGGLLNRQFYSSGAGILIRPSLSNFSIPISTRMFSNIAFASLGHSAICDGSIFSRSFTDVGALFFRSSAISSSLRLSGNTPSSYTVHSFIGIFRPYSSTGQHSSRVCGSSSGGGYSRIRVSVIPAALCSSVGIHSGWFSRLYFSWSSIGCLLYFNLYCTKNLVRPSRRNLVEIHHRGDVVPDRPQMRLHGVELPREALGHARGERPEVRDAVVLVGLDEGRYCPRPLLERVYVELRRVERDAVLVLPFLAYALF